MIQRILETLKKFSGWEAVEVYLKGFLLRWSVFNSFFGRGRKIERVIHTTRGTEHASCSIMNGKHVITVSDKFLKERESLQDSIFIHEIGHRVSTELGMFVWMDRAFEMGLDVWSLKPSTMEMPFQVYNFEEAFAETFSVLMTKDSRGIGLLKKHWPLWIDLVAWAAKKVMPGLSIGRV